MHCPDLAPPVVVAPEATIEPAPAPAPVVAAVEAGTVVEEYNGLTITLHVDKAGGPDHDDSEDLGVLRVTIKPRADDAQVLERPVSLMGCLAAEIEPDIDIIFNDEETLLVEARFTCVLGETVRRVSTSHHVLSVDPRTAQMTVIDERTGHSRDNRGLAVEVEKFEYYVEAGALAIYRHTVAWCDQAGLNTLTGAKHSCAKAPRRLKLLKRVKL